jgi:PKD repeat protein
VASYQWNFGDGGTATGRTASHTYRDSGNFAVSLTIVDALGRVGGTTQSLTVSGGTNPTTSFFISPSSPNVGQSVTFNASTSTAASGHRITSYEWDFGDGAVAGGVTTTHAYSAPGSYTVLLKATDDVGRTGTSTQTVSVGQAAGGLTADYNFSPSSPAVGQAVSFDATTSKATTGRTITKYDWTFDDGTTGSGVQTSHTYNRAGTFIVRLTITDDIGQTATTTGKGPVTVVASTATTADFTALPSPAAPNQPVTFDASLSRPGTGRAITTYSWNFDDGATATGVTASHPFTASRTYNVRLTVTDDSGQTATTSKSVVVSSVPPTARFTFSPQSPVTNQVVSFDASTSTASGSGPTIIRYAWDFGDSATATGVQTSHSYLNPGTYTVRLTVTDDLGQTNTSSQSVVVSSGVTAIFEFSPLAPATAQPVFFDARQSFAPAGRSIVSYSWTWGDGTPATTVPGPTTSHAWAFPNTYVVRLTVTDDTGRTGTTTQNITVGASIVIVPNVVGLTAAAAQTTLANAGLVGVATTAASATVPAGLVISQSPVAGSSVARNSVVSYVVSTGP